MSIHSICFFVVFFFLLFFFCVEIRKKNQSFLANKKCLVLNLETKLILRQASDNTELTFNDKEN